MGDGRNFVLKFGPASILVRCDGQELAGPLSEYLKGHLTDSQSWNAEIELKFSKALCPVPTRARLALRYVLCCDVLSCAIPGLITVDQVKNAAAAVKERRQFDLAEAERFDALVKEMWANLPENYQWLRHWEWV